MNEIDTNSVLLQMRSMAAKAAAGADIKSNSIPVDGSQIDSLDFSTVMKNAINEVNKHQQAAARMSDAFERGQQGVELTDVMIQMQKASVSFEAITQVRNRLVSAYQDVMNMPI